MRRVFWGTVYSLCLVHFSGFLTACGEPNTQADSSGLMDTPSQDLSITEITVTDSPVVDTRVVCTSDQECSNSVFCDGVERCVPSAPNANALGCIPANPARACPMGMACSETTRQCVTGCLTDDDGDGHVSTQCGGDDCDDSNPQRFAGRPEICDPAGVDDDCDPLTLGGAADRDRDGDGFVSNVCCNVQPNAMLLCGDDCNDNSNTTNPGANETCNNRDDNCNTMVDEGVTRTFYRDTDGDNYGSSTMTMPVTGCVAMNGYVENSLDCDDTRVNVNPAAVETCDGVDNNCNGATDEGLELNYYPDMDADGRGATAQTPRRSCMPIAGFVANNQDCDDTNPTRYVGNTEVCDGVDNNCNGTVDEGLPLITCYQDRDRDGYGVVPMSVSSCVCPQGTTSRGAPFDCNDNNADVYPGQPRYFSVAIPNQPGDFDYDCSGVEEESPVSNCPAYLAIPPTCDSSLCTGCFSYRPSQFVGCGRVTVQSQLCFSSSSGTCGQSSCSSSSSYTPRSTMCDSFCH